MNSAGSPVGAGLLLKVIIVSASGVLSPGPMTTATAALGVRRGWRAGLGVALGHTIVELPLVLAIAFGLALLKNPVVGRLLSLGGGAFMVAFGLLQLRGLRRGCSAEDSRVAVRSSLLAGVALSALNPFFIIWWLGVGSPLVVEALAWLGMLGVLIMYIAHVWMDFAWYPLVAHLAHLGRRVGLYVPLLVALSILLIMLGVDFIVYGAFGFRLLPL